MSSMSSNALTCVLRKLCLVTCKAIVRCLHTPVETKFSPRQD